MTDSLFVVWHTEDAPEPVRFAAAELSAYLGRMTGFSTRTAVAPAGAWPRLELHGATRGERPDVPEPLEPALLHRTRPANPDGAGARVADAFLWRIGDGEVTIAGINPRSVLFGVYDLLEELGCRFFGASPDDEVVPRLNENPFGAARERFEQASFPFRERHFLEWIDVETTRREIDHAAKRRMNGFSFHIEDFAPDPATWQIVLDELIPEVARRGLMPGLGEHGGYPLWLPPERYAAEYPDWYAEIDGRRVGAFHGAGRYQFCTENPEALATFLDNMEAFLRAHPLIQIMHIAPEDAGRWCECPRCRAIPVADRYLRIGNAIAERVHQVRPDAWVTHLVYANHAELPTRERPSPRLNVSFVPFGRDYRYPFADPRANLGFAGHPWSLDLIEGWARLCRESRAGLVEHTKAFRLRWVTFRLLPLPYLEADLRWWYDLGAIGFNAPQEGEGWWVKHLNSYVLARLMWDLDGSAAALLDDYFARYWEGVGDEVRAIDVAIAEALPNLSYARNQPAMLHNRAPGVRLPSEEQLTSDLAYLENALAQLDGVSARASRLRERAKVEPVVARRLAKLADAIDGARASLAVSLEIRRFLLARLTPCAAEAASAARSARNTPGAAEAASAARSAHDRFAALQTPERLAAGTLWTGAWRRDATFAAWEREAKAEAERKGD